MKSTAIQGAANLLAAVPRAQGKAAGKVPEVDFSVVINQTSFQNQETLQDSSAKLTEKNSGVKKVSDDRAASWTKETEKDFKVAEKVETQSKEETASPSEDRNVTGQKENNLQDISEETVSKVEDFLSKVREAFQDGFSMTEEELLSALEQLGFTMADFLNPDTLNACVLALSGAQDSMTLLVDEQLYTTCTQIQKEVMALTEVFSEEVQLTPEEMELVLSKLEEMQKTDQFSEAQSEILSEDVMESDVLKTTAGQRSAEVMEGNMVETTAEQRPAEVMEGNMVETTAEQRPTEVMEGNMVETTAEQRPAEVMESNMMETTAEQEVVADKPEVVAAEQKAVTAEQEEVTDKPEVVVTEQKSAAAEAVNRNHTEPRSYRTAGSKDEPKVTFEKSVVENLQENQQESSLLQQNLSGNGHQNQSGMQLAEPTVQNVFDADAAFTSFTTYDGSYESIIRQVAEQIHVQVTADTSSMEMQLNPESLGRLTLSVELKQGMMTAKFIAENEQVKEAIESQAAVLREDLDRQGVKVEAIEVAVETHEFERNLEQGQQQSQAEEEARNEQSRRNSRRNLNLDILEEEEDLELTEAEDLAAKIMRENGNTMDYFA